MARVASMAAFGLSWGLIVVSGVPSDTVATYVLHGACAKPPQSPVKKRTNSFHVEHSDGKLGGVIHVCSGRALFKALHKSG